MNIISCVQPGVDLALSRQVYRTLEAEHLRAYSEAYPCPGLPNERPCAIASFNLAVKEARMYKVFEATIKLRSN